MSKLFDIQGHVVVITGGTGVLGRCIAKYLAQEGARVVVLGRKESVGQEVVADIVAQGGEACFLKADVMDQGQMEGVCNEVLAR